ncbi:UDP-3-O-acyl-N-acetylglucosamine deacetylase [Dongia sp.]|uniref:UDP-3-O-acyl-N-acetylglucosamine deacetylase n=1 Tax=Dongia sp. TaxID=1977262 RepID=UPI003753ABE5
MSDQLQHTLAREVRLQGITLHGGRNTAMTLVPSPPDSGIVFRRGAIAVAAHWRNAVASPLCSTLRMPDGTVVRTVEHLLAAFVTAGIDNAEVILDGDEVPICDGSAAPLLALIDQAGAVEQERPRRRLRVLKPFSFKRDGSAFRIGPAAQATLALTVSFPNFGRLRWEGPLSPEVLRDQVVSARTFGFLPEALVGCTFGRFRSPPLLRGGSLRTALVMVGRHPINPSDMPASDELVRHRVLDAVGDLALAGAPLLGAIAIYGTRHTFIRAALEALFAAPGTLASK